MESLSVAETRMVVKACRLGGWSRANGFQKRKKWH